MVTRKTNRLLTQLGKMYMYISLLSCLCVLFEYICCSLAHDNDNDLNAHIHIKLLCLKKLFQSTSGVEK